jgi:GNAT superfamily N-acetyltransferase
MPEIQIRPVVADDIPKLITLDHDYVSDHVWQMDIQQEEGDIQIAFRLVTLPRSVRVEYPRPPSALAENWSRRSGLLAAVLQEEIIGYTGFTTEYAPLTTWVTDLVVMRRLRRQGIGSALILAVQQWAKQKRSQRILMEMQPKNYPAICLTQKLGFDLCGYNDRYYANHDIALFFGKGLR